MSHAFAALTFAEIAASNDALGRRLADSRDVQAAAEALTAEFCNLSRSCVLARVFIVLPQVRLPPPDSAWAAKLAASLGKKVDSSTPVLALLSTAGREPDWNDRTRSVGHRAIPLVDRSFVEGAPMIAALLRSFQVDSSPEAIGGIHLRSMSGRLNARFFVEDSATTLDAEGRHIIAAREFVARYKVQSVFGMGGTYVGGERVAAIFFTSETLTAAQADRFAPFIGTFKLATADLVHKNMIFANGR